MCSSCQVAKGLFAHEAEQEQHLQSGLPGLALHGPDTVQQLHKEVPPWGSNVALHCAQEATEHVHLDIILVHAGTGHQPGQRTCTHNPCLTT